jgi:predicted transcriptional regulator
MKAPVRIRTAQVLAVFDLQVTPLRQTEIAQAIGATSPMISGHLTYLAKVGKLKRVARGQWVRVVAPERDA